MTGGLGSRSYRLRPGVLSDTERLLAEPGARGLEAVMVWVGQQAASDEIVVLAAIQPRQIAYSGPEGVAVEVPPDAISDLISALPAETFLAARVHTHPTNAYHSSVDDQNMLISHDGAISIVVPYFAQYGMRLDECSVNELRHGAGWVELSSRDVSDRFSIDD